MKLILLLIIAALPLSAPAAESSCHPGVLQLARGDYAGALRSLAGSTSRQTSELALLNNRGLAELMSGKSDQARTTFEAILRRDPAFSDARFNLGIVALGQSDLAVARTHFTALSNDAANVLRPRAAYHLALTEDRAGNLAAAEKALRDALAADPSLSEAKLYLGVILERQKKFVAAGEAYRDYLADDPQNQTAMLRFGIVAYRAGYLDTARRYLRLVAERTATSNEAMEARKYLLVLE